MDTPVITLTTDFGTVDPYVGIMKGVILGIDPRASIVDISHNIQPQAIAQAAFMIGTSHRFFPKGTIHVVVVDPGVGTSRNALLVNTPDATFIAPDNGVLSYVVHEGLGQYPEISNYSQVELPRGYMAYNLTNQEYWLRQVSSTFHGRDIFAPVAAHLSLGVPPHRMGQEVQHLTCLPIARPYLKGDILMGEVVHIDHFGNLITNITLAVLPWEGPVSIEVKGHLIAGLSSSYQEGGTVLAIIGAHGNLEVSVKNGSAAQRLKVEVGDVVRCART